MKLITGLLIVAMLGMCYTAQAESRQNLIQRYREICANIVEMEENLENNIAGKNIMQGRILERSIADQELNRKQSVIDKLNEKLKKPVKEIEVKKETK